jgi:hypothetical protein
MKDWNQYCLDQTKQSNIGEVIEIRLFAELPNDLAGTATHPNFDDLPLVDLLSLNGKILRPMVFLGTIQPDIFVLAKPTEWGYRGAWTVEANRVAKRRRRT